MVFNLVAQTVSSSSHRCAFALQEAASKLGKRLFPLMASARGMAEASTLVLLAPALILERSLTASISTSGLVNTSWRKIFNVKFAVFMLRTPSGYLMRSSSIWSSAEGHVASGSGMVGALVLCLFDARSESALAGRIARGSTTLFLFLLSGAL